MKERMGAKAVLRSLKQQAPDWIEKLPQLPQLIYDNLQQNRGAQQSHLENWQVLQQQWDERRRATRRALLIALALAGGAALMTPQVADSVASVPWYAWVPLAGAILVAWRA